MPTSFDQPTSDPTDVVGLRVTAWVIDLFIYLALVAVVTLATGGLKLGSHETYTWEAANEYCRQWEATHTGSCWVNSPTFEERAEGDALYSAETVEGAATSAATWVLHLLAYALIQGLTGASLGKLIVGLRVVTADGQVAGVGRSFVRTISWLLDALTCGLPVIGGVMIVSNRGHRRLGDMFAGTYVVRKGSVGLPITFQTARFSPAQPPIPPAPPFPGTGHLPPGPIQPSGSSPWGGPQWPPAQPPAQPLAQPPTPPPLGSGAEPVWDAGRNTYIRTDPSNGAWLQWDPNLEIWVPLA